MENYIAIGDIHGRYDLLTALLTELQDAGDYDAGNYKLVFLGDYVDRGPDSYNVIKRIKMLCENGKAIALRGNHEDLMLGYHRHRIFDKRHLWIYNGGGKTIESYGHETKLFGQGQFFQAFEKDGHAEWMKSLPYYYETDKVFFSHAPVPLRAYRQKFDYHTDAETLTWSWHGNHGVTEGNFAHDHGKLAVCGHVHALREGILEPRIYEHIIYADTGSGCGPDGRLSAIIITDGKYEGYLQAAPQLVKKQ